MSGGAPAGGEGASDVSGAEQSYTHEATLGGSWGRRIGLRDRADRHLRRTPVVGRSGVPAGGRGVHRVAGSVLAPQRTTQTVSSGAGV
ncbi:hypothetical protein GCM10010295_03070 [Streptomyces intermedius]